MPPERPASAAGQRANLPRHGFTLVELLVVLVVVSLLAGLAVPRLAAAHAGEAGRPGRRRGWQQRRGKAAG